MKNKRSHNFYSKHSLTSITMETCSKYWTFQVYTTNRMTYLCSRINPTNWRLHLKCMLKICLRITSDLISIFLSTTRKRTFPQWNKRVSFLWAEDKDFKGALVYWTNCNLETVGTKVYRMWREKKKKLIEKSQEDWWEC